MLRLSGTANDSIVDGKGLRFTVFTQGCMHCCPGCHNPQTHDPSGGYDCSLEELWKKISVNPLLDGVTFSGGEPMLQAGELAVLAQRCHKHGLNVWVYSGYTLEQLLEEQEPDRMALLAETDVLVDGPFLLEQRSLDLLFRGSANQRILNVPESLRQRRACLLEG